jgi:hypothetical protein
MNQRHITATGLMIIAALLVGINAWRFRKQLG